MGFRFTPRVNGSLAAMAVGLIVTFWLSGLLPGWRLDVVGWIIFGAGLISLLIVLFTGSRPAATDRTVSVDPNTGAEHTHTESQI